MLSKDKNELLQLFRRNKNLFLACVALGIFLTLLVGKVFSLKTGEEGVVYSLDKEVEIVGSEDVDLEAEVDELGSENITCLYAQVEGAVKDPGSYCIKEGDRVFQLLEQAGGIRFGLADEKYLSLYINQATKVTDEMKVYITFKDDFTKEGNSLGQPLVGKDLAPIIESINKSVTSTPLMTNDVLEVGNEEAEFKSLSEASEQDCIDINNTTLESLISINGIGEVTAQKVLDKVPLERNEDILLIDGIGDATYSKIINELCE